MKPFRVLVIKPDLSLEEKKLSSWDGIVKTVAQPESYKPSLEVLQLGDNLVALIDEDGKARRLEMNPLATTVVRLRLLLVGRTMLPGDFISGNAVFVTEGKDGVFYDVPDTLASRIRLLMEK